MDRFAELTGRQLPPVRLRRRPRGRARDRHDGLGRRGGARDGRVRWSAQGEKVGVLKVRLYRPVRRVEPSSRRCRRRCERIAVLDRTKEPGAVGEPLYLDVVTALRRGRGRRRARRARCRGSSAAATACRRKEFTPAMVKAVFDELAEAEPQQPLHRRHRRRRHPHCRSPCDAELRHRARRRRRGRSSSASAPTARSAPTRTRSRSSARRPTTTPRATSSTTRRSPARSPSRTCASARGRSARPT